MIPPIAPIGSPTIAPGMDPPDAKSIAAEVAIARTEISTQSRFVTFVNHYVSS